jgi:hypothetical protein
MHKNLFSFLILIVFLFGCGKKGMVHSGLRIKSLPPAVAAKIPPVKNIVQEEETVKLVQYPATIRRNLYEVPDLSLKHPFNSYQALFKLFPGRYFASDGNVSLSWWTSSATKKKKFPNWSYAWDPYEETDIFPWKESQTEHLATYKYTNAKGEECILYSVSSTEFSSGVIHCGRFTGGILGMALFIRENDQWMLKKFNPAVGCYGNYACAFIPNKAKTQQGEEVFYFTGSNGGAGGPYIGNHFVVIPTDTSYIEACVIRNSACYNRYSGWDTELEFISTGNTFPDIVATTEGRIDGSDSFLSEFWGNVPETAQKYAQHHYAFKFRETKEYQYTNGKYELTGLRSEVWNKGWKFIQ